MKKLTKRVITIETATRTVIRKDASDITVTCRRCGAENRVCLDSDQAAESPEVYLLDACRTSRCLDDGSLQIEMENENEEV